MSASLPDHLAALLQPQAYPHPVSRVVLVETHISWILLTGELAYKIKRPVFFPFLDLRSLERRAFLCKEEVRLNRRFAPQLYMDVCPIAVVDGRALIDASGPPVEYAVKMRQFQREDELDNLLTQARVAPWELEAFGRDLAVIHGGLRVAEPSTPWGDPQTVQALISRNLGECVQASSVFDGTSAVRALRPDLDRELQAAVAWMYGRRQGGRVRECHGDLHAANLVRLEGRLVAFDCLEFEPAFRWIDVADEVAFLLADLDARGYPQHGQAFLGGYLNNSGDYQACRLLRLYKAHRALVRAKVAALSWGGAGASGGEDRHRSRFRSYLECASRALAPPRPILILMSGLSGSGKTWLAQRLAPILGAVHLRSDVERKRLAGLAEHAHSGSAVGQGLYSRDSTARVYDHLASAAEDVLSGGYVAIVDATFGRREDRRAFQQLAQRMGVRACLIHCRASREVLVTRVVERDRTGNDASDADVSVLDWQKEHWEPVAPDEQWRVIPADTADTDLKDLGRQIGELPN
jgi:aminoglycoside phosphotransferase family enzyme/predicted kinase